jgi:hypothetical protein
MAEPSTEETKVSLPWNSYYGKKGETDDQAKFLYLMMVHIGPKHVVLSKNKKHI